MICSNCGESNHNNNAHFCFNCGRYLKKRFETDILFYGVALIVGVLSAWATIELKVRFPNISIFYCVGMVSILSYLILRVLPKDFYRGIKNISSISVTSGMFFILTCLIMVILSQSKDNTMNTYVNSFFIGSAHISILIIINILIILYYKFLKVFFNFNLNRKYIHRTLDTAETILDISTPKGLIKHLKKLFESEKNDSI